MTEPMGGQPAMWCTQCGRPAAQGDRYCESCGTPLVAPQAQPASAPTAPKRSTINVRMVVLLSILLGLIVIGGIEFVGSQGRTRHKFVQSPNGIGSTYTPTTARSRWIPPMDFVEVPGRPNFAARVIPESETNCDSFTSCWNVSVVSRNGCSYGIQVTMKVETPSGTIIDSASDSFVGEVGPEQVTLLKPENTSGQSQVTGEVTRVSCFLD